MHLLRPIPKYVLMVLVLLSAGQIGQAQQTDETLPPAQEYRPKVELGIPMVFTPEAWNGITVSMPADTSHRLIDPSTLLRVVYAVDEIPGFLAKSGYRSGVHTNIALMPNKEKARILRDYSSVETLPHRSKGADQKRVIGVIITVYPTPDAALREAQRNHPVSREGYVEYYTFGRGLPSEASFGFPFWTRRWIDSQYEITAVVGCTVVHVWLLERAGSADASLAEALMWGLIARIKKEPELWHPAGDTSLNGVVVEPVSLLQRAGCQIQIERPFQDVEYTFRVYGKSFSEQLVRSHVCSRWRARVYWGQRWVELEAFSWQMKTWDGRQVKLSRPVFPYRGNLVAPLQEVKQALGMLRTF